MCGPLNNPLNGQVTIVGSGIGAPATYSCNTGYILRGVVSRVCQVNGQWSGSAPTCEGSFLEINVRVCVITKEPLLPSVFLQTFKVDVPPFSFLPL